MPSTGHLPAITPDAGAGDSGRCPEKISPIRSASDFKLPANRHMTHSVSELYDIVNSFMTLFGEKPFERETSLNEVDDLESLIARYVKRLRDKEPKLKNVPDELIPDALLGPLRDALATMRSKNG